MADRIVVMNHGVIEQIGTPTEIYREPKSLFVADFIGEMNQIPAVAGPSGHVRFGDRIMQSLEHAFNDGDRIVAAIRPNDIIPHGAAQEGSKDAIQTEANAVEVLVAEMEFLGAFWRCRLQNDLFGGADLIADFSINAVRRLELAEGCDMVIELPEDRLIAFDRPERHT